MNIWISRGYSKESGGDIFFENNQPKGHSRMTTRYCCNEEFRLLTGIRLKRGEFVKITVSKVRRWKKDKVTS